MRMMLKTKKMASGKRTKASRLEAKKEMTKVVRSIFLAEVNDNLLLGEVREALRSPKRRDIFRKKLVLTLFTRGRVVRDIAKLFAENKQAWMSEVSWSRIKRAWKKYKKARKGIT